MHVNRPGREGCLCRAVNREDDRLASAKNTGLAPRVFKLGHGWLEVEVCNGGAVAVVKCGSHLLHGGTLPSGSGRSPTDRPCLPGSPGRGYVGMGLAPSWAGGPRYVGIDIPQHRGPLHRPLHRPLPRPLLDFHVRRRAVV